ncbi:hypothetical protein [Streptomyces caatingaensis]|uniref:hypothetical protein n=1 Tax=Streptomyces caatingaensis TaxID=1678637 RepID=UPI0012FE9F59|nr:hypothetical protein [Streptomyces caatingaensis]
MNTQGVLIERAYGRAILGGFHAMSSLGGIAGAALGGIAASRDIATGAHFTAAAAVPAVLAGVAAAALLPGPRTGDADPGPLPALPGRGLWIPGLIAFCALMGGGVMNDWGAVYLRDVAGASAGTAGAGFAAFSAGVVLGRLSADRIRARTGPCPPWATPASSPGPGHRRDRGGNGPADRDARGGAADGGHGRALRTAAAPGTARLSGCPASAAKGRARPCAAGSPGGLAPPSPRAAIPHHIPVTIGELTRAPVLRPPRPGRRTVARECGRGQSRRTRRR